MIAVTPADVFIHTPAWTIIDHRFDITLVCQHPLNAYRIADLLRAYGLHDGIDAELFGPKPAVRCAQRLVQHKVWVIWWESVIIGTASDRTTAWRVVMLLDKHGLMDIPDTLEVAA